MSREIKFRAWQSQEKKMYIQGDAADENRKVFWNIWENKSHISNPMQFTGLKDKNGTEIYTGDLVRQSDTLYEIRDCIGGWECQIWKEYKNGGAEEGSTYTFSCLLDYACKIVGNIYQNPELITNR